jgi:hypothetical protein
VDPAKRLLANGSFESFDSKSSEDVLFFCEFIARTQWSTSHDARRFDTRDKSPGDGGIASPVRVPSQKATLLGLP